MAIRPYYLLRLSTKSHLHTRRGDLTHALLPLSTRWLTGLGGGANLAVSPAIYPARADSRYNLTRTVHRRHVIYAA